MSNHFAFTDYLSANQYIDTHRETTMKVLIVVDPESDETDYCLSTKYRQPCNRLAAQNEKYYFLLIAFLAAAPISAGVRP